MRPLERPIQLALREGLSRHTRWRGDCSNDGRFTLVTVNWNTTDEALNLVRSFRAFMDADESVVVVDNAPSCRTHDEFGRLHARYVTAGVNLGHGLGLDFGMRFVRSEYALVCDPDTAILDSRFRAEVATRVEEHGVAAADTGNPMYHPLCVAFRTEHWKRGGFSFLHRWPYWDTGGELTHLLGGVRCGALIPKTRSFGAPLPAAFGGGGVHYLGEVYGDVFSSTYLTARLVAEPDRQDFDGWSRTTATAFHRRWNDWVGSLLAGHATVDDFPAEV